MNAKAVIFLALSLLASLAEANFSNEATDCCAYQAINASNPAHQ